MKCPNCKSEMEKGSIPGYMHSNSWVSANKSFLVHLIKGGIKLLAYRCPKCGKIELTTEV